MEDLLKREAGRLLTSRIQGRDGGGTGAAQSVMGLPRDRGTFSD